MRTIGLEESEVDLIVGLIESAIDGIDPANAPAGDEEDTRKDRTVYEDLLAKFK